MAGSNQNSGAIDELISKDALDSIQKCTDLLQTCYVEFEKFLKTTTQFSADLKTIGTDFDKISKVVQEYTYAMKNVNVVEKQHSQVLDEKTKLEQKLLQLQSQEGQAIQKLRMEVQMQTKSVKDLIRANSDSINGMKVQNGSIIQMQGLLAGLVKEYNFASAAARKQLAPAIKELQDRINAANADIGRHQGYVGQYGKAVAGVAKQLISGLGLAVGVQTLGRAMSYGYNVIKEFESAQANLAAILGTSRKEMTELTKDARELGATTEWTASKVSELQLELAKLGFSNKEILDSTKYILAFATAMDANLADAAYTTGAALRSFGLDTTETQRVVEVMAQAANRSALSFEYIHTTLAIVAPVAKAFNFSIEDTMALLGTLADAGFDASRAGTALRNIILNLADSNGKLAKAMGGTVTGFDQFVPALKQLRAQGIELNETLELTDKRSVAAFNRFLDGADAALKLRGELNDLDGTLEKMRAERMDTLVGSTKLLTAAWNELMLVFGESTTGPIKDVIDSLKGVVQWITKAIKAKDDYFKVPTESSWYKQIIEENRESSRARLEKEFASKTAEGWDVELIFKVNRKETTDELNEYAKQLDTFMKRRQQNIDLGIIKDKEWSKSDSETYNKLKLNIDSYTAHLEALNEIYEKYTKNQKEATGPKTYKTPASDDELLRIKRLSDTERKARNESKLVQLQEDLDFYKRVYENEQVSYNERIDAADKFAATREKILNIMRENEIDDIKAKYPEIKKLGLDPEKYTADQRVLINQKADLEILKAYRAVQDKKLDITEYFNKQLQREVMDNFNVEVNMLKAQEDAERVILAESYKNKQISKKKYDIAKAEIGIKYAKLESDMEIKYLTDAFNMFEGNAKIQQAIIERLHEVQEKTRKKESESTIASYERQAKLLGELEEKLKEIMNRPIYKTALTVWEMMTDAANMYYDNQIARIDALEKREMEYFDNRLKFVQENLEAGLMSEEEAAARTRIIEEERLYAEQEFDRRRREMQRKQAMWQKANGIVQATINTAQAVTSALAVFPPWLGIALAATVGALGAAQIGLISAQSVPAYAHGTDSHIGGLALVGDGGKSELVRTPSGNLYKTPSSPTLVDIPKNSIVYPDFKKAYEQMALDSTLGSFTNNEGEVVVVYDEAQRELVKQTNKTLERIDRSLLHLRGNASYTNAIIKAKNFYSLW